MSAAARRSVQDRSWPNAFRNFWDATDIAYECGTRSGLHAMLLLLCVCEIGVLLREQGCSTLAKAASLRELSERRHGGTCPWRIVLSFLLWNRHPVSR